MLYICNVNAKLNIKQMKNKIYNREQILDSTACKFGKIAKKYLSTDEIQDICIEYGYSLELAIKLMDGTRSLTSDNKNLYDCLLSQAIDNARNTVVNAHDDANFLLKFENEYLNNRHKK